jgi:hypothetical protein
MHDLPPYVEATIHLPIYAEVHGKRVEGRALGRRADRVFLSWRSDLSAHLGWVPAAVIERRQHTYLSPPACS